MDPRPDFLILGAPKAGTTALHAALARHPEVFVSSPKEAKYFLCDGAPPPAWRGPGDAHSQQEWIWREDDYRALFAPAPPGSMRGESTPFYLWSLAAQRRIVDALPGVRLIAVVRDPVDRAFSNWMHLWSDGLEPEADFLTALSLERERIDRGWAPFWRYRELGLYGHQLQHLHSLVPREQVLVLRYRELVDRPEEALRRTAAFLGIDPEAVASIPGSNSRDFVEPGVRQDAWSRVIRLGAYAGQFARPEVWRAVHPSLIRLMHGGRGGEPPRLSPEQRATAVQAFSDDITLLEQVTGDDYSDWRGTVSRGSFRQRAGSTAPSGADKVESSGRLNSAS